MNRKLQKIGGIAALVNALAYVAGFVGLLSLLDLYYSGTLPPSGKVTFLLDNVAFFQAWNLVIYIIFGISLVVLVIALNSRLKTDSPVIMQMATAFGLVWAGFVIASGMIANVGLNVVVDLYAIDPAQASLVWVAVSAVQEGIGGGIELVGGLWVLLTSCAALRFEGLPRMLNHLGFVIGIAGVLTVIPVFGELGAVFGIGQVIWFLWLGTFLLLAKPASDFLEARS